MGLTLPGAASIPAPDSRHAQMATLSGKRIVEMVWEDLTIRDIVDARAIDNAVTTVLALGGSTNADRPPDRDGAPRRRRRSNLDRFDALARRTPVLANIRPSGKYLMEDFYYAGGLRGLMSRLTDLLDTDGAHRQRPHARARTSPAPTVYSDDVIRPRDKPLVEQRRPRGAARQSRARRRRDQAARRWKPHLQRHTGRAVVFRDYNDMAARIDDPALEVDKDSVLVLQSAGPQGAPGLPEWGQLPIPKKLLQQGVRDMVRISDARMSGTSYGACVLHVAPESLHRRAARAGARRRLDRARRPGSQADAQGRRCGDGRAAAPTGLRRKPHYTRGFGTLYLKHVTQANEGCDFDFLEAGSRDVRARDPPELADAALNCAGQLPT